MHTNFLPTTRQELQQRGWHQLDVILVSGDSYIDSPYMGIAVIGRVLENAGFKVGIIAQPQVHSDSDITRLGEPRLFWGVSGGSVDSMVANYTANKKKRRRDDYTPGGINDRRPDRALIAYVNLIRRFFKNTRPIVLGGMEASLRRLAHYDFWDDAVRRSILLDAKADYLLYGMAEKSVLSFVRALNGGEDVCGLRGLCYIGRTMPPDYLELPSFEQVSRDHMAFINMFHAFYQNNDPQTARGLAQRYADRFLVHNPPEFYPLQSELDGYFELPYQRAQHPYYEQQGRVKALETIRFSINTHRGCYGECNFCSIAVHEGRTVHWRSEASILKEAAQIASLPDFKGYILDVGGPTANMYGFECALKLQKGACRDKRCIYPLVCSGLKPNHQAQLNLLRRLRQIPGIKKVFIASGIRYDLLLADRTYADQYIRAVAENHVSGQLKVAPEHSEAVVLEKMGKPGTADLLEFKRRFDEYSRRAGKRQFLTYYLIAAHPGCGMEEMLRLKNFVSRELHISPEQLQIFTPLPSTYSALMYYTGLDPFTLKPLFVEKNLAGRENQKRMIIQRGRTRPGKKNAGY